MGERTKACEGHTSRNQEEEMDVGKACNAKARQPLAIKGNSGSLERAGVAGAVLWGQMRSRSLQG